MIQQGRPRHHIIHLSSSARLLLRVIVRNRLSKRGHSRRNNHAVTDGPTTTARVLDGNSIRARTIMPKRHHLEMIALTFLRDWFSLRDQPERTFELE